MAERGDDYGRHYGRSDRLDDNPGYCGERGERSGFKRDRPEHRGGVGPPWEQQQPPQHPGHGPASKRGRYEERPGRDYLPARSFDGRREFGSGWPRGGDGGGAGAGRGAGRFSNGPGGGGPPGGRFGGGGRGGAVFYPPDRGNFPGPSGYEGRGDYGPHGGGSGSGAFGRPGLPPSRAPHPTEQRDRDRERDGHMGRDAGRNEHWNEQFRGGHAPGSEPAVHHHRSGREPRDGPASRPYPSHHRGEYQHSLQHPSRPTYGGGNSPGEGSLGTGAPRRRRSASPHSRSRELDRSRGGGSSERRGSDRREARGARSEQGGGSSGGRPQEGSLGVANGRHGPSPPRSRPRSPGGGDVSRGSSRRHSELGGSAEDTPGRFGAAAVHASGGSVNASGSVSVPGLARRVKGSGSGEEEEGEALLGPPTGGDYSPVSAGGVREGQLAQSPPGGLRGIGGTLSRMASAAMSPQSSPRSPRQAGEQQQQDLAQQQGYLELGQSSVPPPPVTLSAGLGEPDSKAQLVPAADGAGVSSAVAVGRGQAPTGAAVPSEPLGLPSGRFSPVSEPSDDEGGLHPAALPSPPSNPLSPMSSGEPSGVAEEPPTLPPGYAALAPMNGPLPAQATGAAAAETPLPPPAPPTIPAGVKAAEAAPAQAATKSAQVPAATGVLPAVAAGVTPVLPPAGVQPPSQPAPASTTAKRMDASSAGPAEQGSLRQHAAAPGRVDKGTESLAVLPSAGPVQAPAGKPTVTFTDYSKPLSPFVAAASAMQLETSPPQPAQAGPSAQASPNEATPVAVRSLPNSTQRQPSPGHPSRDGQQQQQQRRRLGWGQGLARLKSNTTGTTPSSAGTAADQQPLSPSTAATPKHGAGFELTAPAAPAATPVAAAAAATPETEPLLGGNSVSTPRAPPTAALGAHPEGAGILIEAGNALDEVTPLPSGLRVRTSPPPAASLGTPEKQQQQQQQLAPALAGKEEPPQQQGQAQGPVEEKGPSKEFMVGRIEDLDHEIAELEKALADLRADQQRLDEAEASLSKALARLEGRPPKPLPAWSGSDVSDVDLSSDSELSAMSSSSSEASSSESEDELDVGCDGERGEGRPGLAAATAGALAGLAAVAAVGGAAVMERNLQEGNSDLEMPDAPSIPSPSVSSTRSWMAPAQHSLQQQQQQQQLTRQPSRRGRRGRGRGKAAQRCSMDLDGVAARLGPAQRTAWRVAQAQVSRLTAETICQEVLRRNKQKALRAHAELGALAPAELLEGAGGFKVPAGHAAFVDVSELPQYKANLASHARTGKGVAKVLRQEYAQLLARHVELAVDYRERAEAYDRARAEAPPQQPVLPLETTCLKRTHSTHSGGAAHGAQQAQRDPLGSPLARTTSRARSGDIVRSDYEEKQAIATLQAIELVKHMTDLPPQEHLSARAARWAALLDVSRRVSDPVRELEEQGWVRPWSEQEKRIFMDKFLVYHKEFAKIQAHLPQRTVQEVVALYYAIQHTDEFAHTRRKYLLRKRREQADANSRRKSQDTVLGMSIADPSAFAPSSGPVGRSRTFGPTGDATERSGGRGGRGRSRGGGAAASFAARQHDQFAGLTPGASLQLAVAELPLPGWPETPPPAPVPMNPEPPVAAARGPRKPRRPAAVVQPLRFAEEEPAAVHSGLEELAMVGSIYQDYPPEEEGAAAGGVRRRGSARNYAALDDADWEEDESGFGRGDKRIDAESDALFVEAVQLYGKDMKAISRHLGNKTMAATRLYWSRHRSRLGLDELLEERAAQGLTDNDAPYVPARMEGVEAAPGVGPAGELPGAPSLPSPAPGELQDLDAMQQLMQQLLAKQARQALRQQAQQEQPQRQQAAEEKRLEPLKPSASAAEGAPAAAGAEASQQRAEATANGDAVAMMAMLADAAEAELPPDPQTAAAGAEQATVSPGLAATPADPAAQAAAKLEVDDAAAIGKLAAPSMPADGATSMRVSGQAAGEPADAATGPAPSGTAAAQASPSEVPQQSVVGEQPPPPQPLPQWQLPAASREAAGAAAEAAPAPASNLAAAQPAAAAVLVPPGEVGMHPSQEHAELAASPARQHSAMVSQTAACSSEPASGSLSGAVLAAPAAETAELEAAAVLGALVDEVAREAGPPREEGATGAGPLLVEQVQPAQQERLAQQQDQTLPGPGVGAAPGPSPTELKSEEGVPHGPPQPQGESEPNVLPEVKQEGLPSPPTVAPAAAEPLEQHQQQQHMAGRQEAVEQAQQQHVQHAQQRQPLAEPLCRPPSRALTPAQQLMSAQELGRLQGTLAPGGMLFHIIGDPARCAELSTLLANPERLLDSPSSIHLLAEAAEQARLAYASAGPAEAPVGAAELYRHEGGSTGAAAPGSATAQQAQQQQQQQGLALGPEGDEAGYAGEGGAPSQLGPGGKRASTSYWSQEEKDAFIRAFKAYGRDWSRLHAAVPAKTLTQIKNYYQNYRTRLGLDKLALPPSAVQPGSRKRKGTGGGSGGERGHKDSVEGGQRPERVPRRGGHADAATAAAAASLEHVQQHHPQPHRPKALRAAAHQQQQAQQPLVTSGGFPLFRGPGGQPFFATAAPGMATPGTTPHGTPLGAGPLGAADPAGVIAWVQRYNQSVAELLGGAQSTQQGLAAAAALYGMFGGGMPPGAFMAAAPRPAPAPAAPGMDLGAIAAAALPMLGMVGLGGVPTPAPQTVLGGGSPAEQLARLLQGGAPSIAAAAAAMQAAATAPSAVPAATNQAAAALQLQMQLQALMQGGMPPHLMALRGLPPPAPLHPAQTMAGAVPPPLFAPPPASAAAAAAAAAALGSHRAPIAPQQPPPPTSLSMLLQQAAAIQQQAAALARPAPILAPVQQQQQQQLGAPGGPPATTLPAQVDGPALLPAHSAAPAATAQPTGLPESQGQLEAAGTNQQVAAGEEAVRSLEHAAAGMEGGRPPMPGGGE